MVYTINLTETVEQFLINLASNSFDQIKSIKISEPDESRVMMDVLRDGKFYLQVNSKQIYAIYPDYLTIMRHDQGDSFESKDYESVPNTKNIMLNLFFDQVKKNMNGKSLDSVISKSLEDYKLLAETNYSNGDKYLESLKLELAQIKD